MIDPAALSSASPAAAGPGAGAAVLAAAGGNPVIPGAFASLLATGMASSPTSAPPKGAMPALPGAQPADDARQDLAAPAAATLPTGKILPSPLPNLAAPADGEPAPAPAEAPRREGTLIAPLLTTSRAARSPALRDDPTEPSPAAEPTVATQTDAPTQPAAPNADPMILALPQAPLAAFAAPATPAGPASSTTATPARAEAAPLPSADRLPPTILAQLPARPLASSPDSPEPRPASPTGTPTPAPDERSLRLSAWAAAATGAGPIPFTLVSPAAPSVAALRLRPVLDDTAQAPPVAAVSIDAAAPSAPATGPQDGPGLAQLAAPAMALTPQPAAAPAAAPQAPAHSFTAVVDRLMAAREAARADSPAQPVAVNLHHAEFGEVSVRFEHRADGLAVALASPDPDFARAVQAAAPASPDTGAGLTGQGSQPSSSLSASSGQAGQPQQGQRGSAPAQPERAGGTAPANPSQAAAPAEAAPARPRGIFA